jgi:hypothetical protein
VIGLLGSVVESPKKTRGLGIRGGERFDHRGTGDGAGA